MVNKIGEVHLNLDHLEDVPSKLEFRGEFYASLKEATESVLSHRLRGVNASLQNSSNGMFEILVSNNQPETRVFNANDFRELGAGVYEAMSPAWDSGSVWTVYSSDEGNVILSKLDSNSLERITDSDSVVVESQVNTPTMKSATKMSNGHKLVYKKGENQARGTVVGFDDEFNNYIIQDDATKELDYIPANDQPYSIEEPDALVKSLDLRPHDDSAYSSGDVEDAYDYWQQDEDTVGNEEIALMAEVDVYNNFRSAFQSRDLDKFRRLAYSLISSAHPKRDSLISSLTEDFPTYFIKSF